MSRNYLVPMFFLAVLSACNTELDTNKVPLAASTERIESQFLSPLMESDQLFVLGDYPSSQNSLVVDSNGIKMLDSITTNIDPASSYPLAAMVWNNLAINADMLRVQVQTDAALPTNPYPHIRVIRDYPKRGWMDIATAFTEYSTLVAGISNFDPKWHFSQGAPISRLAVEFFDRDGKGVITNDLYLQGISIQAFRLNDEELANGRLVNSYQTDDLQCGQFNKSQFTSDLKLSRLADGSLAVAGDVSHPGFHAEIEAFQNHGGTNTNGSFSGEANISSSNWNGDYVFTLDFNNENLFNGMFFLGDCYLSVSFRWQETPDTGNENRWLDVVAIDLTGKDSETLYSEGVLLPRSYPMPTTQLNGYQHNINLLPGGVKNAIGGSLAEVQTKWFKLYGNPDKVGVKLAGQLVGDYASYCSGLTLTIQLVTVVDNDMRLISSQHVRDGDLINFVIENEFFEVAENVEHVRAEIELQGSDCLNEIPAGAFDLVLQHFEFQSLYSE